MKKTRTTNQKKNAPILRLQEPPNFRLGKGFGTFQSFVSTKVYFAASKDIDLEKLDQDMRNFLPDVPIRLPATSSNAHALLARIHAWQAAIQRDANIPVFGPGFGYSLKDGTWSLMLPYFRPLATQATLDWLFATIGHLISSSDALAVSREELQTGYLALQKMLKLHAVPGTNIFHFIEAGYSQKFEVNEIANQIMSFGIGCNSTWLDSTVTTATSGLGLKIARNKYACARVLDLYGLPTPRHGVVTSEEQAVSLARKIGFPVVIKPLDLDGGIGVFSGLSNDHSVIAAFRASAATSPNLLVEKHIAGEDFRLTVCQGKLIKIMHRRPGGITGDGLRSIRELLAEEQLKPDHQKAFQRTGKMRITLDAEAIGLLQEANLTPDSIPGPHHFVALRRKSNVSTGGSHSVVPISEAHPDNIALAIDAASATGLDIAGIDLLITDIGQSWHVVGGAICEVNGRPQIGYRDTPEIYDQILSSLIENQGKLGVHLLIGDVPPALPRAFLKDIHSQGYNSVVLGTQTILGETVQVGRFRSSYHAARAVLANRQTTGAVLFMTWQDVIKHGLPAGWFTSIRVSAPPERPQNEIALVREMIRPHSAQIDFPDLADNISSQLPNLVLNE